MKNKRKNKAQSLPCKFWNSLLLFAFLSFITTETSAQGLANTCWKNAFGSNARITTHDLSTGEFRGTYGSTTGSAGYYTVIGKTPPNVDLKGSFPLTFTIGWGKINGTPDDASQYWTSTMSGRYNGIDQTLTLLNVISAPGPFEAVKILSPGNLPQSQSFTLVSIENCDKIKVPPPSIPSGDGDATDQAYANLLLGSWNVNADFSRGGVFKMVIENLVPRGKGFSFIRYYELTGYFYLDEIRPPIPFSGIASPYTTDSSINNGFGFGISVVATNSEDKNIALSGYGSPTGNGNSDIQMFLTVSSDSEDRISSGELFQKN